ncbi:uncharacterized protein [Choristoneura fumiferana]|uniref:uncharacterized protein n=1 Tax=Choristoneura fumiferana TaxID=7141 RepID=UPI003D15C124
MSEIVLVKIYKLQKTSWAKGAIIDKIGNSVYLVRLLECNSVIKRHANQLLKWRGEIGCGLTQTPGDSNGSCIMQPPPAMPAFILDYESGNAESELQAADMTEPRVITAAADDPAHALVTDQTVSVSAQVEDPSAVTEDTTEEFASPDTSPEVEAAPRSRRPRKDVDNRKYF